ETAALTTVQRHIRPPARRRSRTARHRGGARAGGGCPGAPDVVPGQPRGGGGHQFARPAVQGPGPGLQCPGPRAGYRDPGAGGAAPAGRAGARHRRRGGGPCRFPRPLHRGPDRPVAGHRELRGLHRHRPDARGRAGMPGPAADPRRVPSGL
ncbi:MAG: hypothetical protein AVDCRST_MAG83-2379, partial [uncultured Arthrobacter sp.]